MEYPIFKYMANAKEFLNYSEDGVVCDCCGKTTNIFTDNMYTAKRINAICVDCIKSGEACKKFDGEFNTVTIIDNKEAIDELVHKTPAIQTFQEIDWPACCNDFCKFLRIFTDVDFENEQIWEDIKETFDEDEEGYSIDYVKEMDLSYLLLYKCEICGKHHIKIDVD
ncbi:MAG: CbrC family protein [Clostridia bacterium]|nr:CbrC family protein [Clostridia bacterium]